MRKVKLEEPYILASIVDIARAARDPLDHPDLTCMIYAYFDDSSDDRRARYSACGGFIGDDDSWSQVELLWIDATHRLKKPFRSTDCECQKGQFANWEKRDCDALMSKLVGIVQGRLGGFAAIVPCSDYKSTYIDSGPNDPFYLAVKHTLANVAHMASIVGEPCKCWFEESQSTQGKVNEIYVQMKAVQQWHNRRYLGGIGFLDKRVIRIQAADLIAREAFKHIDNLGIRQPRKPVVRLQKQISFHLWTKKSLEALRDGGRDLEYFTSKAAVMRLSKT